MTADRFALRREKMVGEQLRARGIRDTAVLKAMEEIPRHLFVPPDLAEEAYEDHPLSIGQDQTISQPYIVALMTEQLRLKPGARVLEVGTGSGYQTAVLSKLAQEVYSVEVIPQLSEQAAGRLELMLVDNVHLKVDDGSLGWPDAAPFDGIIVTAAAAKVPDRLAAQLADGGRMVIPVGEALKQTLTRVERHGELLKPHPVCECVFVPLV